MADIKTLVEEAKRLFRLALEATDDFDDEWRINHAAKLLLTKSDAALDALAEAHQAEVATLNAEVERVRGICDRDNEMFRSTMQAGLAIREGLRAEVARLTRENEGVAKDAARLDWMIEAGGFIVWTVRDDTIRQCQVWTQDEDEVFHQPAGETRFFNTTREAIDAALAGASGAQITKDEHGKA